MKNKTLYFLVICIYTCLSLSVPLVAAEYADSLWISPDINSIIIADRKPYAMLQKKGVNVWNGQLSFDIVSLTSGNILWSDGYTPGSEKVFMTDQGLLTVGKNVVLYDYESGKKLNKIKIKYAWHDDTKDIVIGYNGNKLAAYKLSSAEKLWESELKNKGKGVWSTSKFIDDEELIFASSNMAGKVSLLTGEIFSYPLKREIHDNKGNALKIGMMLLGGVAGAVTTGYSFIPIYGFSKFGNLGSNIINDEKGRFYVADRDAIICLDNEFNEFWRNSFPKNAGSSSRIYLTDNRIDLLNLGTGTIDRNFTKVGKPFWASYNADNGECLNISILSGEGTDNKQSNPILFAPDSLFYYSDALQKFVVIEHNPDSYPVITVDTNEIITIVQDLNTIDIWKTEEVFRTFKILDDGRILSRCTGHPDYVWIDENGYVKQTLPDDIDRAIINSQGIFVIKNNQLYCPSLSKELLIKISYLKNNRLLNPKF